MRYDNGILENLQISSKIEKYILIYSISMILLVIKTMWIIYLCFAQNVNTIWLTLDVANSTGKVFLHLIPLFVIKEYLSFLW